jgi:hypothetical protein
MITTRYTAIIPASFKDQINEKLLSLAHGEVFTSALCTIGSTEITHYWSSMNLTDAQLGLLQAVLSADEIASMILYTGDDMSALLEQYNLTPPEHN